MVGAVGAAVVVAYVAVVVVVPADHSGCSGHSPAEAGSVRLFWFLL